ncbi:MAG: beta-N-acetylhexosaminidase [Alphaproteobacteria bacterium]|mgnify:CR=1 FL=1|nr:beta-N-acetylhexosaminidase [Alphaproteobacteria bacterium]|tara:strand:+ start:579054 stop:579962 length:909 start_codon:yes stop_codon:yes gene_type:complete
MIPAIFSVKSTELTPDERRLFQESQPLGFILFARNIDNPTQLRKLTANLKEALRRDCPILIDQEGGRVQRMRPPHWPKFPAAGDYQGDMDKLYDDMHALATMLIDHGINVNCAPVLDIRYPVETDIIGDRAYSYDAEDVIAAGKVVCRAFEDAGVIPVSKHLPGHGRARADTHFHEAVIDTPLDVLDTTDFRPFRDVQPAWGMVAHVILSAVDSLPATLSEATIKDVIRQRIGYKGVLVSDDLSMKALAAYGSIDDVAEKCLAAGCDIALYCAGEFDEMAAIAARLPQRIEAELAQKITRFV